LCRQSEAFRREKRLPLGGAARYAFLRRYASLPHTPSIGIDRARSSAPRDNASKQTTGEKQAHDLKSANQPNGNRGNQAIPTVGRSARARHFQLASIAI
jgi:hypothetical protein